MTANVKDNPRVSLIVLSYNQEKYISEALDGAFNQDYDNLEIVVSDDCSTDSTWSIITEKVKNYNGKHKIIINKNEVNIGLVRHVNKVLSDFFNGDFIAWAAGDDISTLNRISSCIDFFNKNEDVVALSTNLIVIDSDSKLHLNQRSDLDYDAIYDINYYLSDTYKHVNGPSRMMRRELIHAFPPLNDNCPTEDTTMLLRAFLYGKVAVLKDKLVKYRVHTKNLSSEEGLKKMNFNLIFNQYYDDVYFHFNKKFDEHMFIRIMNKIEKIKSKRIEIVKNDRTLIKKVIYKLLAKTLKGHILLLNAWNDGNKTFSEVLLNVFHSKFPSKSTIKLGGSTWSKNYGDALNVPLINGLYGSNYFESYFTSQDREELFMIGSIIHKCKSNTIIWGSGCINAELKIKNKPKKVTAVRGPLTREVLLKNGIECPEIYGDPALLLPLLYKPKKEKKYKFGILPHYIDLNHKSVREFRDRDDTLFIDIQVGYQNWQSFIDKINECEYILTSSLHGVIISDAYNVPNLWVKFSEGVFGNGFKFHDYFASVSKNVPDPIDINNMISDEILLSELNKWQKIEFDNKPLLASFPYGSLLNKFSK